MKLKVTKSTQTPNGDFTLTLTGEEGLRGEIYLPVPPPEKEVLLYDIGQEFTLTAGPKPVQKPVLVAQPGQHVPGKPPAPPAPVVK